MRLEEFLKKHGLSKKDCEKYLSKKHTYLESDQPVMMFILKKSIEGQDILVLSKTAAEKVQAKEVRARDLTVAWSEELQRYGLIMPIDSTPIDDIW